MPGISEIQEKQLQVFQENIRKLRSVVGWSGSDLADMVGVTRQTINNLETGKSQISPVQYLALCAVVDKMQRRSDNFSRIAKAVLDRFPRNKVVDVDAPLELLEEWFYFFPDMLEAAAMPDENALLSFELMKKIADSYKIILSPNLLLKENVRECIENLASLALEHKNMLIVPATALQDLMQQEQCARGEMADWINRLQSEGKVCLYGQQDDPPFNELLLSQLVRLKKRFKTCFITDDRELIRDVLALNSLRSFGGYPISVLSISLSGILKEESLYIEDIETLVTSTAYAESQSQEESGSPAEITAQESLSIQGWESL